jgi:hypothetical protein
MKTIAITLFAAGIAFAQSTSSDAADRNAAARDRAAAQTVQNQKPAAQKAKNQKPKEAAKAEPPVQSIPAGAKQIAPNIYQLTDSSGKTWNYRQTPFGINKWEETGPSGAQTAPEASPAKSDPIAFTDLGDSYRFEKKTPFGTNTWVRKKSELSDDEKTLVAGPQTGSASKPSSDSSKPAGN